LNLADVFEENISKKHTPKKRTESKNSKQHIPTAQDFLQIIFDCFVFYFWTFGFDDVCLFFLCV